MDEPSSFTNSRSQSRQKRILPSRSRRGGPGVGSCDADLMILETQRRRFENEPLIPVDTQFLLTTNPAVAAKSSATTGLGINIHANDRYFDRPEVLKAYREQQIIQTPEFVSSADVPTVGGRFRARNSEDGTVDTSDAAYEKRHRKYESFEKRQRLREKEKLKHEQYKLKERIEQLRAMDGGAFLALPASSFSPVPAKADGDSEYTSESLSGSYPNGAAAHSEGERRRKEMLDVALMLEERYRVLLPPDRLKKLPGQSGLSNAIEAESSNQGGGDTQDRYTVESEEEPFLEVAQKESQKLKLKIKFPKKANAYISTPPSAPYKKGRKSLPPTSKPTIRKTRHNTETASSEQNQHPPLDISDDRPTSLVASSPPPIPADNPESIARPTTPMSNPDIAVLEIASPDETPMYDEERYISASVEPLETTVYVSRPHKRPKITIFPRASSPDAMKEPSVPPIESISVPNIRRSTSRPTTGQSSKHVSYAGAAGRAERTNSVLMVAAIRSSGNSARKAKRHLSAFGTKLRSEIFEEGKDFELPAWVYPEEPNKTEGNTPGPVDNLDMDRPIIDRGLPDDVS